MIPDSFIEELKNKTDIEQIISSYVSLKRKGGHLTGLCPFHSEKTPSFTVFLDSDSYYCFGCGNGGDAITFIRNAENLEYIEAIKFLAEKAGMQVPDDSVDDKTARLKTRILEINRESARFFHSQLIGDAGKDALQYLLNRGLTKKTIRSFGLGYAPEAYDLLTNHLKGKGFSINEIVAADMLRKGQRGYYEPFRSRIIFPIIDLRGSVVGFGGRALGDRGAKYLNSSDTPVFNKKRNIFALYLAKSAKSDTLILGEGYMDVISMHQAGFTNAVATLGTSLTEEQARLISRYCSRVVIAYDSDGAGQNAAKRAINLFAKTSVSVAVLQMKDAKDPDEYIKKFGSERFGQLVKSGKAALSFEVGKLKEKYDIEAVDERGAFVRDFCDLMAGVDSDTERMVYTGQIARELELDTKSLTAEINKRRERLYKAKFKKEIHNLTAYAQDNAGSRLKSRHNTNIEALAAEENLIAMLLKNPDYYDAVKNKINAGNFTTPGYGEIFSVIADRLEKYLPVDMTYLAQWLTNSQISTLSRLIAKTRELYYDHSAADDLVAAIKAVKSAKTDDELKNMTPEEAYKYALEHRNKQK